MAVVYLAEQREPVRRRVALKLLKWRGDSRETAVRLEAERQALASLSHPGVAQLYEAGTTDEGQPYFAMEHVEGGPITRRCDELRLPIERRLRLFQAVCEAVEHAHGRGIVHRDLKPSNILLGGDAERPFVKVIDFGLAKALEGRLTDRTAATRVGELLGTPAYMAPEQADPRVGEIGPATDVYALGVVLYELLSGVLPFDPERLRHDPVELARILREEEPRSLSSMWSRPLPGAEELARRRGTDVRSLRRLLRGELSWIVHKCLEKDPRRRYASARELSADLERHLTHVPVRARPAGLARRMTKAARRNRRLALPAVLAGLALAAGAPALLTRPGRAAATERLTGSGLVRCAGLSPSGRYVLLHGRSREPLLWLLDRSSGSLERLPDLPGRPVNGDHRFSADGREVYVKAYRPDASEALFRLSLGAAEWTELRRDLPGDAALSPDGQRIAGVRADRERSLSRLVVANARGGRETTLASRPLNDPWGAVAWSTDGRTLAATVGGTGDDGRPAGVVEIDATAGTVHAIGPRAWSRVGAKAWLPDDRALLLVAERPSDPAAALYRLDRFSGDARRVPLGEIRPSPWHLSLSADGRTLAVTDVWFHGSLWVLPSGESSRAREVATALRSPRFLPDGDIVFAGLDGHLWTVAPAGASPRLLLRHAESASPTRDGGALVITLRRDGVSHVYRSDRTGRGLVRLSHRPAREGAVAPDGSRAVFVAVDDGSLWTVPLAGGVPALVSSRALRFPTVSGDGRLIAAMDAVPAEFAQQARILGPGEREERVIRLPPRSAAFIGGLRFAPGDRHLDYAHTDERGVGNIWRVPLEGGAAVALTQFQSEPMGGLDWSADGRSLVCLRGGARGDAYLVRGEW
jgi:Tol biopolymer transport system component